MKFYLYFIMVTLGFISQENLHAMNMRAKGNTIYINGHIEHYDNFDFPPNKNILLIFNSINSEVHKTQKLNIVLDSYGGAISTSNWMNSFLLWIKSKGVTVRTHVPNGADCLSSCVIIYAAGSLRTAGYSAIFGFHQAHNGLEGKVEGVDLKLLRGTFLKAMNEASPEMAQFVNETKIIDKVGLTDYFAYELQQLVPSFIHEIDE
jgi:ATP-dependent protease ClpP protease subunit